MSLFLVKESSSLALFGSLLGSDPVIKLVGVTSLFLSLGDTEAFVHLTYSPLLSVPGQILYTDVVYLHGSGGNREADKLRHLMIRYRYYVWCVGDQFKSTVAHCVVYITKIKNTTYQNETKRILG